MRIVLLVICWLLACRLAAQVPFVQNYYSENAPNFEINFVIAQSAEGLLYVSGRNALFTYDGAQWESIKTLNNETVRGLYEDPSGVMWVATSNGCGYLQIAPDGQKTFVSLNNQLTDAEKKLPTAWDVAPFSGGAIFRFQHHLVAFARQADGQFRKTASFPAVGDQHVSSNAQADGSFYVTDFSETRSILWQVNNGKRNLVCEDTLLNSTMGIEQLSADTLILFTRNYGMLQLDLKSKRITPFVCQFEALYRQSLVYTTLTLPNGHIAIGTSTAGVLIMDKQGRLVEHFDESNGLQSNQIHSIYYDRQGNLWLGCGQGVSKVAVGLPFRIFDKFVGLKERVNDVLRHQGILYAATNAGLMYWENNRFQLIKGTESQCWQLLPYGKGVLVAGGNWGVFYVEGKQLITLVEAPNATMKIAVSRFDSTLIYNATYGGLRLTLFRNRQFTDLGLVEATAADCRHIVEVAERQVWLGSSAAGFFRVTFPAGDYTPKTVQNAQTEHIEKGLRESKRNRLYPIGKEILFTSLTGVYRFDEASKSFVPYPIGGLNFAQERFQVPTLHPAASGDIWVINNGHTILRRKNDGYFPDSLALLPVQYTTNAVLEDQGTYWLATNKGIIRYDSRQARQLQTFPVRLSAVRLSASDSLLPLHDRGLPPLDYEHNSLVFHFSAHSFHQEKANVFQYQLENYDTHWSPWSTQNQKEYTNLKEGHYVFMVKAKNAYGEEGEVLRYAFTINPPWYRQIWAYLLYLIAGAAVVGGVAKWNAQKLLKEKAHLESVVSLRTAEIAQQKEEILVIAENLKVKNEEVNAMNEELNITLEQVKHQKEEIEDKNKNIIASINYAKRIQKAMLPFEDRVAGELGAQNFFILYKPRDIVSGDFYWFERVGELLVMAAADCTGHGVPGAFMSMIANQLLYEIVIKQGITSPAKILETLHYEVIRVLKQPETQAQDGMDISVVVWAKDSRQLVYAGAMNPLYYFHNGELVEIKADKKPIGGYLLKNETVRTFTEHSFTLPENTAIYLFSDGYADQFGGLKQSKFGYRRFKELLASMQPESFERQHQHLDQTIEQWLADGQEKQIDDILVMGFRL
jgi:serine phosphatase RsbU (regulator of sigma subunit)